MQCCTQAPALGCTATGSVGESPHCHDYSLSNTLRASLTLSFRVHEASMQHTRNDVAFCIEQTTTVFLLPLKRPRVHEPRVPLRLLCLPASASSYATRILFSRSFHNNETHTITCCLTGPGQCLDFCIRPLDAEIVPVLRRVLPTVLLLHGL